MAQVSSSGSGKAEMNLRRPSWLIVPEVVAITPPAIDGSGRSPVQLGKKLDDRKTALEKLQAYCHSRLEVFGYQLRSAETVPCASANRIAEVFLKNSDSASIQAHQQIGLKDAAVSGSAMIDTRDRIANTLKQSQFPS